MSESDITYLVRGVCLEIHMDYGPGLLEKVYEHILVARLREKGLRVDSQVALYVNEKGLENTPVAFADVVVEDKVILELKAVEKMNKLFGKQLHTYLKLTGMKVGLLINFNVEWILKEGITRVLNNYTLEEE